MKKWLRRACFRACGEFRWPRDLPRALLRTVSCALTCTVLNSRRRVGGPEMLEKWRRSSRGQTILRGFLSGEIFAVGAVNSELQNLAVLQVAETQAACSGDEDVEHGPA